MKITNFSSANFLKVLLLLLLVSASEGCRPGQRPQLVMLRLKPQRNRARPRGSKQAGRSSPWHRHRR